MCSSPQDFSVRFFVQWQADAERKVLSFTVPFQSLTSSQQHFPAGDNKIGWYKPIAWCYLLVKENLLPAVKMASDFQWLIEMVWLCGSGLKTADVMYCKAMTVAGLQLSQGKWNQGTKLEFQLCFHSLQAGTGMNLLLTAKYFDICYDVLQRR